MSNPGNVQISGSPEALATLFGGNIPPSINPTASIPDGMARLSFAGQSVDIDPDESINVADAFTQRAEALGLNTGRVVTYSVAGEIIPASEAVEAGVEYVATTKHDDKG